MPEGEMRRPGPGLSLPTCWTHYEVRGSGPVVVMVHGFSGDVSHTRPLAEALEGYTVVTYDLIGRGYSSCKNNPQTAELFVSQLTELLYALDVKEAHFVGISLGGGIVSSFAQFFPDRVLSLTLIASVGLPLCSAAHVLTKIPLIPDFLFRFCLWSTVVKGLEHEWAEQTAGLGEMVLSYKDRVCNEPALGRSLLSTARHFPLENLHSAFHQIGRAKFPVLLIWGDNDRTCPIQNAYTLKSFIPRANLVVVKGARHCVYTEFSSHVASALTDFL